MASRIKTKIVEGLGKEPGIMSFAYPYVKFWNDIGGKEVKTAWASLPVGQKGVLYTHIPFCIRKCGYCDYASNYGQTEEWHPYVDALEKEIELLKPLAKNIQFESVYFGGGTPTIFCEEGLERLVGLTASGFNVSSLAEKSIEVYPLKRMLRNKLNLLKQLGINRVSIGVQDFNDEVIAFTGRKYSGMEAQEIVRSAMGLFENVNIDLILGLPKQKENWAETLKTTLGLVPQQITIQPFSNRHPGIKFHDSRYASLLPDLNEMEGMYFSSCQMLAKSGYTQISRHQFVRDGVEHKYERGLSDSAVRLGIGAHSISLLPGLTYKNFTSLDKYGGSVDDGKLPLERGFELVGDERMRSYLFYSLSADCGKLSLDEKEFSLKFGQRVQDRFPEEVGALEETGLINVDDEKIDLTPRGVYFTSLIQRTFYNQEFMKRKERMYADRRLK